MTTTAAKTAATNTGDSGTEPAGTEAGTELAGTEAGTEPAGIPPEAADPVRFQESVCLSKGEVFGACQALADADRLLARNGGNSEASALGDLFELLEARLTH